MPDFVTPGSISAGVLALKQGSPVQEIFSSDLGKKRIIKVSQQKPMDHSEVYFSLCGEKEKIII